MCSVFIHLCLHYWLCICILFFYMAAFKRHYALRLAIAPEFLCSYMFLFYVCSLGCWNKIWLCICILYCYLATLHPFNGLFSRTTGVSRSYKGKISLDLNEARDDRVLGCSGISWTIWKQSAYCSRHITTSTPHHSISTGRMLFLAPNQQRQSTEDTKVSGGVCSVCELVHERRTSLQQW